MTSKNNIIAGLDIGTSNIVVVIAELPNDPNIKGPINIIGVGTGPSRGLRKGVVINIELTVAAIGKAIAQAETMAGITVRSVYISLSGSHIKSFNSNGVVAVRNKEVSYHDVEKVIEAAKAVSIAADQEILHVLPQEFIIDQQDGIKDPLGISGVRLEAKVHIVTGSISSARNVVKCANKCGLNVSDIIFSALASARSVLAPEEQELGVCLIDIGGGTSDIVVFQGGAVKHSAVIPVGGNHITNDIAAGLRTPIAAAEEIKAKHGSAMVSLLSKDETIEVPSTGGRPATVTPRLLLAEIIEPRVAELFNLIQAELQKAKCEDYLTGGFVLTGGTAGLKGITKVAEKVFNLPVRVGSPYGVGGLRDLVNDPEYAAAVGLVQHGFLTHKTSSHMGALGNSIIEKIKIFDYIKKVGNWISTRL